MNKQNHQNALLVPDPFASIDDPLGDSAVDFLTHFDGFHSDALFLCKILESSSSSKPRCEDAHSITSHEQLDHQTDQPMSLVNLSTCSSTRSIAASFESETSFIPANSTVPIPSSVKEAVPSSSLPSSLSFSSRHAFSTSNTVCKVHGMPSVVPISVYSTDNTMSSSSIDHDSGTGTGPTFRAFHEKKWDERLLELREFRREHGHSLVPHTYPPNPQLARWVKRQRRQYKLRKEGKASTMTSDREELLESLGFVWDSHQAAWDEKVHDLIQYQAKYGNCLVPSAFKANPKLATWVKCQRRQYKLYRENKSSAMTPQRIEELEQMGFVWELCSSPPRIKNKRGSLHAL